MTLTTYVRSRPKCQRQRPDPAKRVGSGLRSQIGSWGGIQCACLALRNSELRGKSNNGGKTPPCLLPLDQRFSLVFLGSLFCRLACARNCTHAKRRWPRLVVLRLFYGCSTCAAMTVGTVTLRALDRVRERALGLLGSPSTVVFTAVFGWFQRRRPA